MDTSNTITVYNEYGIPRQVTIQEYIAIEAAELARLMEMVNKDAVQ